MIPVGIIELWVSGFQSSVQVSLSKPFQIQSIFVGSFWPFLARKKRLSKNQRISVESVSLDLFYFNGGCFGLLCCESALYAGITFLPITTLIAIATCTLQSLLLRPNVQLVR